MDEKQIEENMPMVVEFQVQGLSYAKIAEKHGKTIEEVKQIISELAEIMELTLRSE